MSDPHLSILSDAALPEYIVTWPEPIQWGLIKRDNDSQLRLRHAQRVFADLSDEASVSKTDILRYRIWLLASLLNDTETQQEAIELCQELLSSHPGDFRVLSWAVARSLDIDLEESTKALEKVIDSGEFEIPHVIGLILIYTSSGKIKKAQDILDVSKALFQSGKAETVWMYWRIRSLVASGDYDAAEELTKGIGPADESRDIRVLFLAHYASKTGDFEQLLQYYEECYSATKDSEYLWKSCELKINQGDWSYVSERAEKLIEEVGTSEALRMASTAAFNDNRFKLCLRLLDENRNLVPNQRLPSDLRRLLAYTQRSLGVLSEAVAEAETLASEDPNIANLLTLADLLFEKGDLKGLVIVARQLVRKPDLTAEQALHLAQIIHLEDHDLAVSLWEYATTQEIADELIGTALFLGYSLGLDKRLSSLLERMHLLGMQGQAGMNTYKFDELVTLISEQREKTEDLEEQYRNGTLPVHIVTALLNVPLLDLYHRRLADAEAAPNPAEQFALFVRHGGRPLMSGFPKTVPEWRLNLDLTSILLAAHIEILEEVEKTFTPLRIPANLIPALVQMRDRITHHQPARLPLLREIARLAESGAMNAFHPQLPDDFENKDLLALAGQRFTSLLEFARTNNGYVVDILPAEKRFNDPSPESVSPDYRQRILSQQAVVEALRIHGPLSDEEYEEVKREIGGDWMQEVDESLESEEIADDYVEIPALDSLLVLEPGVAESLAGVGLLGTCCERFKIYVTEYELHEVKTILKLEDEGQESAAWLSILINRIRQGIDDGIYKVIPYASGEQREQTENTPLMLSPSVQCVTTLLSFSVEDGDVVWIDDRMTNSYPHRPGAPIITICEVLKALVTAEALDVNQYYRKVLRLRAANARFVPIDTDEILHHLAQARVDNGKVVETRELNILRRYIAGCLLRGKDLQPAPLPEGGRNPEGEVPFTLSLARTVNSVLAEVWTIGNDDDDRRAYAEWLLENIYIDHIGLFKLVDLPRAQSDDLFVLGVSLSGLIFRAFGLGSDITSSSASPGKLFLEWLYERVLEKRIDASPDLLPTIAEVLKRYLNDFPEDANEENRDLMAYLLLDIFNDLPKPIADELKRDPDFTIAGERMFRTAVNAGGIEFDPDEFYQAAVEAINGNATDVSSIDTNTTITLKPFRHPDGRHFLCFKHPTKGSNEVIANEDLEQLLESPSQREQVLRRDCYWFDLPSQHFETVLAEIVLTEDPTQRMEIANKWRKASAAIYYRNLYQKLDRDKPISVKDLVPDDGEGLLRHYRFPSGTLEPETMAVLLNSAAEGLIQEIGLEEAIDRLCRLPISLPDSVLSALESLDERDRSLHVRRLLKRPGSPLTRIHLIKILLQSKDNNPAYVRLARRLISRVLSDVGMVEVEALLILTKWVANEFDYWTDASTWSPHTKLIMSWAHAHELFRVFVTAGAPVAWIAERFRDPGRRISLGMFNRESSCWFDVANPHRVNPLSLLLGGLSYAVEPAEEVIDSNLSDLIFMRSTTQHENTRIPAKSMIIDYTQGSNILASFIGGDFGNRLKPLLGNESASKISHASLFNLVEDAIERLEADRQDNMGWGLIRTVLGDLPIHEELKDRFKNILSETDFVELYRYDVRLGNEAIHVASLQAGHLKDGELVDQLRNALFEIASYLATSNSLSGENDSLDDPSLIILDSALNLAAASMSKEEAASELSSLLSLLCKTWSVLNDQTWLIAQHLTEVLPVTYAEMFWPLVVQLRSN